MAACETQVGTDIWLPDPKCASGTTPQVLASTAPEKGLSANWLRWKYKRLQYPKNWRQISRQVRGEAGWRCEQCGAAHRWFHPETGSVVYLQTAHLDHNPQNCARENLRCLCAVCHLRYDSTIHSQRALATKRAGRVIRDLFEGVTP